MRTMASQMPASRLFARLFVQAQIKENIKAPHHWPLWGGPLVVSPHKRPVTRKTFFFSFDDVIMKTIFLNQDLWFEICEISCDNHSMVSCKLIFNVGLHNRPSNGLSTSHYLNQRWLNNVRRHKCASLRNDGLVKSLCISSYMHMRKFHFYVVSYKITSRRHRQLQK